MTVRDLAEKLNFDLLCINDGDREIIGAYQGDLLSWVMGRAAEDNVWITIMSNINVIAVASLINVSCVIFAEGVIPDADTIKIAKEKGINLLSSPLDSYNTAVAISKYIDE